MSNEPEKKSEEELKVYVVSGTEQAAGEETGKDTLSRLEKVVIRVTITNGQARVNLPKSVALKLNLLKENGKPGEARHLQLYMDWSPGIETQPWIVLTPIRVIEEERLVVPEGPESKPPPLLDPKVPLRWG